MRIPRYGRYWEASGLWALARSHRLRYGAAAVILAIIGAWLLATAEGPGYPGEYGPVWGAAIGLPALAIAAVCARFAIKR